MSLTRAILIVVWCLSMAAAHSVLAYVLGYLLPRNDSLPDHQRTFVLVAAAVSLTTAVLALFAVVYVKALWGVMVLGAVSGGMFLYAILKYSLPFNVFVLVLIMGQLLLSRFAIGLNAIDNPGKPRLNPSEEF
ncbi:MAG: hypothetical protein ACK46Q_03190 [Hyphomonas sp.]